MKKFSKMLVLVVLVLSMVFAFAGCGGNGNRIEDEEVLDVLNTACVNLRLEDSFTITAKIDGKDASGDYINSEGESQIYTKDGVISLAVKAKSSMKESYNDYSVETSGTTETYYVKEGEKYRVYTNNDSKTITSPKEGESTTVLNNKKTYKDYVTDEEVEVFEDLLTAARKSMVAMFNVDLVDSYYSYEYQGFRSGNKVTILINSTDALSVEMGTIVIVDNKIESVELVEDSGYGTTYKTSAEFKYGGKAIVVENADTYVKEVDETVAP